MRLTIFLLSVFVMVGLCVPVGTDATLVSLLVADTRDVTTNPFTLADLGVNITSTHYTPRELSEINSLLASLNSDPNVKSTDRTLTPITCQTSRASATEYGIHTAFEVLLNLGKGTCIHSNIFPTGSKCTTWVVENSCSIVGCAHNPWEIRCDFAGMYAEAIRHKCRMWDRESKVWRAGGKAWCGPGDARVQVN